MPADYNEAQFSFHVHWSRPPMGSQVTSFEYHSPERKNSHSAFGQPRGWRTTEAIPEGEHLVLYRNFWDRGQSAAPIRNEYSPISGLVVWIRPAAPVAKKPVAKK